MPGPVLYGSVIDTTCILWGKKCSKNTSCLYYNLDGFRQRSVYLLSSMWFMSLMFRKFTSMYCVLFSPLLAHYFILPSLFKFYLDSSTKKVWSPCRLYFFNHNKDKQVHWYLSTIRNYFIHLSVRFMSPINLVWFIDIVKYLWNSTYQSNKVPSLFLVFSKFSEVNLWTMNKKGFKISIYSLGTLSIYLTADV